MKRNKQSSAISRFGIGTNIRKWRSLRDIKQKDLATALQMSEAAISNIENDMANLTVAQLEDIAIALNVSIEQLLSDPQENCRGNSNAMNAMLQEEQRQQDRELLNAVIASLEKKDNQLQTIMQHFIHTMTELMHYGRTFTNNNNSKQLASRA